MFVQIAVDLVVTTALDGNPFAVEFLETTLVAVGIDLENAARRTA